MGEKAINMPRQFLRIKTSNYSDPLYFAPKSRSDPVFELKSWMGGHTFPPPFSKTRTPVPPRELEALDKELRLRSPTILCSSLCFYSRVGNTTLSSTPAPVGMRDLRPSVHHATPMSIHPEFDSALCGNLPEKKRPARYI